MLDELEFRRLAEAALEELKKHLYAREEENEDAFEVEEQNGVLNVVFDEPAGKFVITLNAPVRQIWISALSTSFKLDWEPLAKAFLLPRTGEQLIPLVDRLIDGAEPKGIAVAVDRCVIPRSEWATTRVQAEAPIEIVTAAAGG